SGYSFFQSTITIDKLVKHAKEQQFTALALTDEEVLYGVVPFYQACIKNDIKPLIGMVVHLPLQEDFIPCILLAKNNTGYKNLLHISTKKQLHNELADDFTELICIVLSETPIFKQLLVKG